MIRRFRTKVKEQGFRTTVKEAGVRDVLGFFALIAIIAVLAVIAARPCPAIAAKPGLDPSTTATISQLKHQIDELEAKAQLNRENGNLPGLAHGKQPPADNFAEEEEDPALSDQEDKAILDALRARVAVENQDPSEIKRSGVRPDGRVELEPINTGCYAVQDSAECCTKIDSRYTIHGPPYFGGVPCMPSAPGTKFKTGNKCEPETYANSEDMDVQGSCAPEEAGSQETLAEAIQRQKEEAGARRVPAEAHDLNLMWVTDCQTQLEWSSVLLLWSAFNVKQPGDFTRIATGCESAKKRKFVVDAMNTVADIFGARDRVTVHFAPKHITDERDLTDGEVYTPYTKAVGVKHFLDNDKPHSRVGVILDPDFVFNRPLKYKINELDEKDVILPSYTRDAGDWKHDVEPGRPVAQLYGLGTGWLRYDRETICGKGSPCTRVSESDAWKYFTMGPPIFMTIDDWIKVAQGWYDFLPIIRRTGKDWMEEMRSYTMSAAHQEQKTAIFQHYMISSKTDLVNDEGWPWLEQNPKLLNLDICAEGKALNPTNYPDIDVDEHPYPPILHYCNAYEPEYYDKHYVWSKYQINLGIAQKDGGNILDCNQPLHEDPPRDLLAAQKPYPSGTCLQQRRQAWALCQIQFTLNDMLIAYKKQKCGDNWNKKRTAYHKFDPRPASGEDHAPQCRKAKPQT